MRTRDSIAAIESRLNLDCWIQVHFGNLRMESWRCQEMLTSRIPISRYEKSQRNCNCQIKMWSGPLIQLLYRFSWIGIWKWKEHSPQECRNRDMRNREMIWTVRSSVDQDRWSHTISGYRGSQLGESRCLISRLTKWEIVKEPYA